jgi:hypothetical protein
LTGAQGYAEPLLQALGAEQICSVDASAYEGSSIVHDMNRPIPESLRAGFSVVIDAGTLEHIFDFPTAMRNCMELVQPGGHLIIITTTNNFMGHGFYQFSPELFFRVCSPENGYEVERVILSEVDPEASWYRVVDPATAGRRVELVNSRPTYLMLLARRVRAVPVLAVAPQQSDYSALWQDSTRSGPVVSPAASGLRRLLPALARRLQTGWRMAQSSGWVGRKSRVDREVFVKVSWLS